MDSPFLKIDETSTSFEICGKIFLSIALFAISLKEISVANFFSTEVLELAICFAII